MISNPNKIAVILLMVFVVGCEAREETIVIASLDHPMADKSFITNDPCGFPCWYGLEVDRSSTSDVNRAIQHLEFIESESIIEKNINWDIDKPARRTIYKCVYSTEPICGYIITYMDVVKTISYTVAYPLTLKNVVEIAGPPSYLQWTPTMMADGCRLFVAWEDKNLAVIYWSETNEVPCDSLKNGRGINPSLQISFIIYMSTEEITDCPIDNVNCFKWPGFEK